MMVCMLRIAVASYKGGVGKTVTAVMLASHLAKRGRTVLVDGDEKNLSASDWNAAGDGLPCEVVTLQELDSLDLSDVAHLVLDTRAGEDADEMLDLAKDMDLLIVPTKPDEINMNALARVLRRLTDKGLSRYRVLIVDAPAFNTSAHDARAALMDQGLPVFMQTVRRTESFNKAVAAGVPVGYLKGDRYAKLASMDYEMVLRELLA